jgi:hypothetical protein
MHKKISRDQKKYFEELSKTDLSDSKINSFDRFVKSKE